ncbi:hypothetical protein GLOTRDRAFT_73578 [Gloeophyllum trabeum ATCC 11539]|uniref:Peptidase A22B, signal peptide peptidase n=1 Tax=Gloeophyllum trabeum (strain ATCC 11539 / FP-39264 / Madison 617) TaxID=670483 RepID=S7RV14_GLOTA|nr:uncharacterized protein GLOTRDRAFT_73578 [Gloeophyllum trabeum ATCC 11539]EPQ57049.1 hypothetical protein GLOTRDRAFT_73578 [Gloeophyllum trabeum ATCC 11539]
MPAPDWDLISSYAGLLALATVSIYAGSHGSLPSKRAVREAGAPEEEEDEEEEDITERLSSSDAWMFPITGSAVLFGLYLVVRFLGKEWINSLLGWYFAAAGVGSVWQSLIALTRAVLGDARWKTFDRVKLLALKGRRELAALSFRTPSLLLLPVGAAPSILYAFLPGARRSALLSDVLALSFAHSALALLRLDSFKTGCILLAGLFFYDVWWVFGTEVMVKVATQLDVPIKLLWPKSAFPSFSTARGFTMLGLGDVVIPGTFVALALRYDHHRFVQGGGGEGGTFAKPYFRAAMGAYAAGLAATMGAMHVWRAAQPALLYLSPACILSFVLTAAVRGELGEAWAWADDPEAEGKAKKEKESAEEARDGAEGHGVGEGEGEEGAAAVAGALTAGEETEGEGKGKKRRSKKKRS